MKQEINTVGTMFTCGGGVDLGARAAGLYDMGGIEINDRFAQVARDNGFKVTTADVVNFDFLPWRKQIDWWHASPPCINASTAKQDAGETLGDLELADAVIRSIDSIDPIFFSLENVIQYRGFQSYKNIFAFLVKKGYHVIDATMNAADYGVPQKRRRLILLASKIKRPIIPNWTHSEYPNLFTEQWIGWYESIEDLIPTLSETKPAPWQKKKLGKLGYTLDKNGIVLSGKYDTFLLADQNAWTAKPVPPSLPAFTITSSKFSAKAYIDSRWLSISADCLKRWQSFPDSYKVKGKTLATNIIGNSVPPRLIQKIIEANLC